MRDDRTCAKCGTTKSLTEFYRSGRTFQSWCKVCQRLKSKMERPFRAPAKRNEDLLRNYGITVGIFDTLAQMQTGLCVICGRPPTGKVLHVDHCHDTGKVRGLLCASCNSLLGRYEQMLNLQKSIETYLDEERLERYQTMLWNMGARLVKRD